MLEFLSATWARKSSGGDAFELHAAADEFDDVVHRGAGLEDAGNADLFEAVDILIGDDAADEDEHVVHFVLLEQIHDARDDGVVRTGKNGKADDLDIFLQGGADDHFGGLAEAGIDDLHAGIAQGASDHLGAAVVAVETGLGDEDTDFGLSGHRSI